MIVRCVKNTGAELGPFAQKGLFYSDQTTFPINVGHEYVVFGMVLFNNGLAVLLCVDDRPTWLPISLFVVTDPTLPRESEFSFALDDADESLGVQARSGYHELVNGTEHYVGLIERTAPPSVSTMPRGRKAVGGHCRSR
jgi:hypothetical protein